MSLQSLEELLIALSRKMNWDKGLDYFYVLRQYWSEAVGLAAFDHTRPLYIRNHVLWVATSSAVWSQTLTFRRSQILSKLNCHLANPLTDIRFSSAEWENITRKNKSDTPPDELNDISLADYSPNNQNDLIIKHDPHTPEKVQQAFNQWAEKVKQRSQSYLLCPECHCPTPPFELQRWGICSICATKFFKNKTH